VLETSDEPNKIIGSSSIHRPDVSKTPTTSSKSNTAMLLPGANQFLSPSTISKPKIALFPGSMTKLISKYDDVNWNIVGSTYDESLSMSLQESKENEVGEAGNGEGGDQEEEDIGASVVDPVQIALNAALPPMRAKIRSSKKRMAVQTLNILDMI
jgi:hypothetical protein